MRPNLRDNPPVLHRRLLSLLLLTLFSLTAGHAWSAPRDAAAKKKIEQAIFEHFLETRFDEAEQLLVGVIEACEDRCSKEVLAQAWMYVGVVRGSGKSDLKGAKQAFVKALEQNPSIALDEQVATPELRQVFAEVKGSGGGEAPAAAGASEAELACTPSVMTMQSRRAVPVQCKAEEDLEELELHYKAFGQGWKKLPMPDADGAWSATIPCSATEVTGTLRWYVTVNGKSAWGSEEEPKQIEVTSDSGEEPPSLPGKPAPARCGAGGGGGGGDAAGAAGAGSCGGFSEPCGADNCCQGGLACISGTCEPARCDSDADCTGGGHCDGGTCVGDDGSKGGGQPATSWLGLHFAFDLATVSSGDSCKRIAKGAPNDFVTCYYSSNGKEWNRSYTGAEKPGAVTAGGFAPATMRLLASYEYRFGSFGLNPRVGFAFAGSPKLLPVHVEVRGQYWLANSTGKGLRPWVHLGAGVAQVDASVASSAIDCKTASTDQGKVDCVAGKPSDAADPVGVKVTKSLGQGFVAAGGGLMFAVAPNHGLVLNVNLMLMLPATGFVLEPSLGYTVGF